MRTPPSRPPPQERPWPAPRGPNAPSAPPQPCRRSGRRVRRRRGRAIAADRPAWQSSPSPKAPAASPQRMGFAAAFRAAIRPLNVRADLAALPWIATHTHALWVPLAITLASTVAIIATKGGDISLVHVRRTSSRRRRSAACSSRASSPREPAGSLAFARRPLLRRLLLGARPGVPDHDLRGGGAADPGPGPGGRALGLRPGRPIIGAFFAARAARYRRFLRLSSPNRARPPQTSNAKKMGDGRTRAARPQRQAQSADQSAVP